MANFTAYLGDCEPLIGVTLSHRLAQRLLLDQNMATKSSVAGDRLRRTHLRDNPALLFAGTTDGGAMPLDAQAKMMIDGMKAMGVELHTPGLTPDEMRRQMDERRRPQ